MNFDIQALIEENFRLRKQVEELSEELNRIKNQSSKNSSKPPSQDNKKNRDQLKNKGGAQPGHKAHHRQLISDEEVDLVQRIDCSSCPTCKTTRIQKLGRQSLFQYVDLLKGCIFVTNFKRENYYCLSCRKKFIASLPRGVGKSPFGPGLHALVSVLTGRYHISKKDIPSLMFDVFRFKMSSGVVSKIESRTSSVLKPVQEEIKREIQSNQECVYVDETPWRHACRNTYAWQASTKTLTLCEIHFRRNKEARDQLLGKGFHKALVSDRYVVYRNLDLPHQYCLAHIFRNFKSFAERRLEVRLIGSNLCEELNAVFRQWRLYQKGEISKEQLKSRCGYRRQKLKEWLKSGYLSESKRLRSFCKVLLEDYDCLWTFLRIPGLEPTNNLAERDLRPLVLWRKKSLGTKGTGGLEFVSTMSSIIQTLKKQSRHLLQFVIDAFLGLNPSAIKA